MASTKALLRRSASLLGLLLWLVSLSACGGPAAVQVIPMAEGSPARDEAALRTAVEAYYTAEDPEGLRAAVRAALAAGPETALAREVAADLAWLEDQPDEEIEHLLIALRDPTGDNTRILLHWLADLDWGEAQRARIEGTLSGLLRGHPDAEIRAFAAWMLAHSLHLRADFKGRDAALDAVGGRLPVAVIGPWDNDQGKAFDVPHEPERGVDLGARYEGKFVELKWRTAEQYPMDPRGKVDLGVALHPTDWQVAYAASAIELQAAGEYELRVGTSDALKIWVDGTPVFEGPRLSRWLFDGVVVPLKLEAGVHQVLIKTGHSRGDWMLSARLTGPGGQPLAPQSLRALPADTAPERAGSFALIEEEDLLKQRVAAFPQESARRAFLRSRWADDFGLKVPAVEAAEAWLERHPKSLRAQTRLALALWDNAERGRTADLLNGLDERHGLELPRLALQQARFWRQQNLNEKARERLLALRKARPDRPGAYQALAALFSAENWHEDRCDILKQLIALRPDWPYVRYQHGRCLESLKYYPQATAAYQKVLEWLPAEPQSLERLQHLRLLAGSYSEATALARRFTQAWPHERRSWQVLAEARRRAGDDEGAAQALRQIIAHNPDHPDAYARLARLSLHGGEKQQAVDLWREALQRDPENEGISNHLNYLAPEKAGAWAADVPKQADLDEAVAQRDLAAPKAGSNANIIYLMDDEVSALGADGSMSNVVTMVAHALNTTGRDQLTSLSLRGGGRVRVLHAYAVDPVERRVEASSIRGRTVRFRQLSVGSTVVLQYRIDERPDGYLAGHIARQWWFQGPGVYTHRGRWVLWAAKGTVMHEERLGPVQYEREEREEQMRHAWSAQDVPALVAEPGMPSYGEVTAHVVMSTVPDWDMFWSWERELLRDAFRVNPELQALADRLFEGAETPQQKVDRIHAYLMTNIRYQQDYEGHIAGVKPHTAPMVVARQYGDCKDKAVLFITLARMVGVDVHFALVRTRDAGPVRQAVPLQQFNHAIVYVPAQEGIAEGRFYDPTVDALDVQALRHDDQGTLSLVFDPKTLSGKAAHYEWRMIPFQDPSVDHTRTDAVLTLDAQGGAQGEIVLSGVGRVGEYLRTGARSPQVLKQQIEQQLGRAYNSARMGDLHLEQVEDLFHPAQVRAQIQSPQLARKEQSELRLRMPVGWTAQQYFPLAQRQWALLMGAPRTLSWRNELALPAGAKVKRLPSDGRVETPCLVLERKTTQEGQRVVSEQTVVIRCERIETADYAAHREAADEMQRLLDEELVLTLPAPSPTSTMSSAQRAP